MSKNIISFVSTRGRDLNSDLQIVKDDLMTALPDMEFQYYLNKTATKIPLINTKMEDAAEHSVAKRKISFAWILLSQLKYQVPLKMKPAYF